MKKNLTQTAFCILACIALAGCSAVSENKFANRFTLDNPTDEAITATVDGKSYDLAPYEYVELTLEPGKHTMTTAYGETVDFIVTVENNGGVLNPSRSAYYKYNMQYVREGHNPSWQHESVIEIDSIEYQIPASRVYGVIIDEKTVDWQFPIHTPFAETTYVDNENLVGAMRYKLFTKKEMIDFLEEDSDYIGYHEANKAIVPHQPYYEQPESDFPPVPDFRDAEMKRLATEMSELDREYGKAETASRQRELLKKYKSLWKAFVNASLKQEYDAGEFAKQAELKFRNFTKGVVILQ